MASIWNEIELKWNDETYTVKPTLAFVNHLEQGEGRSLSKLFMRMVNKDLPSGVACEIIAKTLRWAGADVSDEEVFEATGGGVSAQAVELAAAILVGVMPKAKDQPEKKPGRPRKAKS